MGGLNPSLTTAPRWRAGQGLDRADVRGGDGGGAAGHRSFPPSLGPNTPFIPVSTLGAQPPGRWWSQDKVEARWTPSSRTSRRPSYPSNSSPLSPVDFHRNFSLYDRIFRLPRKCLLYQKLPKNAVSLVFPSITLGPSPFRPELTHPMLQPHVRCVAVDEFLLFRPTDVRLRPCPQQPASRSAHSGW